MISLAIVAGSRAGADNGSSMIVDCYTHTWECGDPGMQLDTTINSWHTCPNSGRINASNPCGEHMHLDNSACVLASLNLVKFLKEDGTFDTAAFCHSVDLVITALDIIVGNASYPAPETTDKTPSNLDRKAPAR